MMNNKTLVITICVTAYAMKSYESIESFQLLVVTITDITYKYQYDIDQSYVLFPSLNQ